MPSLSSYAAPEPAENTPYETANRELARSLDNLKDLVSSLEHRLQDVLVPAADEKSEVDGSTGNIIRAARAPMVSMLEHHTASAESIAIDVSALLNRLCL